MSPDVEDHLAGHFPAERQCPFDAVHPQVFPKVQELMYGFIRPSCTVGAIGMVSSQIDYKFNIKAFHT